MRPCKRRLFSECAHPQGIELPIEGGKERGGGEGGAHFIVFFFTSRGKITSDVLNKPLEMNLQHD